MIVHRHQDGSEGLEYEIGDEVVITATIGGGWFNHSVGKTGKVVSQDTWSGSWRTAPLYVRHSPDWGPSGCMPWQVEPTEVTRAAATVVEVDR